MSTIFQEKRLQVFYRRYLNFNNAQHDKPRHCLQTQENEDKSRKQLDKLLLLRHWQLTLSVSNVVETRFE